MEGFTLAVKAGGKGHLHVSVWAERKMDLRDRDPVLDSFQHNSESGNVGAILNAPKLNSIEI
jgi:hypothetical protein